MRQFINSKQNHGFTLIEVMLVVFVVAITALIFAAIFPTSQISHTKAAYLSYATSMAQQQLESLKAAGYANAQIGTQSVTIPIPINGTNNLNNTNESLTATQTTTITQYATDTKEIQVRIVWDGYRKAGGTVSLVTLMSNRT